VASAAVERRVDHVAELVALVVGQRAIEAAQHHADEQVGLLGRDAQPSDRRGR